MADVGTITEAYIPLEALDGGRVMLHVGNGTGQATEADLPTKLTNIMSAQMCPEAYDISAAVGVEVWYCNRTISSGKVTVGRKVDDTAHDDFSFILAGKVY
ncbi:hypothetical protein ES703_108629 [subsurface metagenome]